MNLLQELQYLSKVHNINLNHIQGFIENGNNKDAKGRTIANNYAQIARDNALSGMANTTVPAALLAYWDPKAIEILTKKRSARDMFPEVKKGNFASNTIHTRTEEVTGQTAPYSDYAQNGVTSTNYNFPYRDVYRFQTLISIGDLESEMAAEAKIQLVADKQRAATTMIDIDANRFYLLGVAGKQIFGILNDPNLPPAISPSSVNGSVLWENKTTKERYQDILRLFKKLADNVGGYVDANSSLVLAVSPSLSVLLGDATDFNVSVLDMLNKYFANIRIVTVPELHTDEGIETMCLYPTEILGQTTGELLAPEKFRTYPVYRKESSITQKVAAATAGAIIYRPLAFVRMTGL